MQVPDSVGKFLSSRGLWKALSVKETEKVSEAVQAARNSGLGVVIIDHNIGHVHRICDRIVIMEGGRVINSVRREDITARLREALES